MFLEKGGVHKALFLPRNKSLHFCWYITCSVPFTKTVLILQRKPLVWSNMIMEVGGVIQYEPEVPYFKYCFFSFKIFHI